MTRRRSAVLVHIAVAALSAVLVRGQTPAGQVPERGLTLAAAMERALAANPTITASRLQRPIDVAGVAVARQRPNPEIVYEWERETPRQSIGATVPIELGGKRQRRIDLANATIAVTDADLARIVAEVRNDVRRTYFDVVAADVQVQIADDVRGLAQRARDAANARVVSGDVPRADLTQADLALANADNDVVAARGEAAATRAELNALLGQPVSTTIVLADTLGAGTLPSMTEALALSADANGELKVLDRRIEEQLARVKLTNALRTPDLGVGGTVTYDAFPEFRVGWRATFGVTVPILSSPKVAVTLEESVVAHLRAEREAALARISGALAAALSRATAARDQLANYQNTILPLALEAERQAQAAYTGGQIGLPALIQALQIARETRQRGLQAGLDFQHALADLERAIGAPLR